MTKLTLCGIALGFMLGLVVMLLLLLAIEDRGRGWNRRASCVAVIACLAWLWLPWVFYGLSMLPWSTLFPPGDPTKGKIECVEKMP